MSGIRPGAGTAIACVLLPPLGAWLLAGIGRDFWIAVVLTCLFFVPGIVWALVLFFRGGALPGGARQPAARPGG